MSRRGVALGSAIVLAAALPEAVAGQGLALAGGDVVHLQLPGSARVEPYANSGYRLSVAGEAAAVEVSLAPLSSRDPFPGSPLPGLRTAPQPLARLAKAVTSGARSRYEASSRLLGWVARNVTYELDRAAPQDAAAVLSRRRGYCTGIARLTVALLGAVGIPAREVPGFVVAPPGGGVPAGFHRWIEVRFDDVGWVFSDPLLFHHYVPATYVRLASEALRAVPEPLPGTVLARRDRRQAVDLFAEAPPGVSLRRNSPRQRAATLTVSIGGGGAGAAVLEGAGRRRVRPLEGGASTFVGLEPGSYLLRIELDGHEPIEKLVTLRGRVAASVHLPPVSARAAAEKEAT